MAGPEDKKTSWGGSPSDKAVRRRAKAYKVTGEVPPANKTQGNGARELGTRRAWRWLFGNDED